MSDISLWQRQRVAVCEEISRTALELFLAYGFEETTVDQIVRKVGVSRRSFFRYFGTKEDIVLGDLVARGQAVAEAVAARPEDEGAWEALRAGLEASAQTTMSDERSALALGRMLFETPSLRARLIEKRLRWQEMLVPLITARMAADDDHAGLRASAVVAASLACLDAASEAWIASDGAEDLSALYDEAVASIRLT